MPEKIYVIEAELKLGDPQVLAKRDALGRNIFGLAEMTGEPVWFHEFRGALGGAPLILLECSDEFMDLVRHLPGFVHDCEVWADTPTRRSPRI